MALVAQLSDAHLLELDAGSRVASDWARVAFLSSYRPSRAATRARRLERVLGQARDAGADHLVITGDLTEDAAPGQFALFAQLVRDVGFAPEQVTIVPGNHDAYRGRDHFRAEFDRELAPFAASSLGPVALDGITLLPLDSTIDQHYVRAAGRLGPEQRERLARLEGPVLVAQHHPPIAHSPRGLGWFQELEDLNQVTRILDDRDDVYVLHGHVHRHRDSPLARDARLRVFSPEAVVESPDALRLYEVDARGVRPVVGR